MDWSEFQEKLAKDTGQFPESIVVNAKTILKGFQILIDEINYLENELKEHEKNDEKHRS